MNEIEQDRLEAWADRLIRLAKSINVEMLIRDGRDTNEIVELGKISYLLGYAQSASQFIKTNKEK